MLLVESELVQVEALTPELIHGAVHMQQHAAEAVVFVWIALLPEEYVGEFQRPAEYHGLQVVYIVISITMQQVELLSPEPFYQPRDITVIVTS